LIQSQKGSFDTNAAAWRLSGDPYAVETAMCSSLAAFRQDFSSNQVEESNTPEQTTHYLRKKPSSRNSIIRVCDDDDLGVDDLADELLDDEDD
jgi:hypothetical protein